MESSGHPAAFHGSGLRLLLKVAVYLAAGGFVLSVLFMGAQWARLFVAAGAVMAPCALAVALFAALSGRFSFDDAQGAIVRPFRRPIPYGQIRAVYLRRSGGLLQVRVARGALRRTTLASALRAGEEERLRAELGRRFPAGIVRRRRLADHVMLAAVLAALVLAGAAGHLYLYRKTPQLGVTPQKPAWEGVQRFPKKTPRYSLYSFSFALPKEFLLIIDKGSELVFEDKAAKTRISAAYGAHAAKTAGPEALVRRALGMGNYLDILDLSWSARVGIVPLVLKGLLLEGLDGAAVYRIEQGTLRGFMVRAGRDGRQIADVLLADGNSGEEIELFLSGPKKAPDRLLRKIIGSVEPSRGALPE